MQVIRGGVVDNVLFQSKFLLGSQVHLSFSRSSSEVGQWVKGT